MALVEIVTKKPVYNVFEHKLNVCAHILKIFLLLFLSYSTLDV